MVLKHLKVGCLQTSCSKTLLVSRHSRIMTKVHESTLQTPVDAIAVGKGIPSGATSTSSDPPEGALMLDIEHALVEDDPRAWSNNRKVSFLF